LTALAEQIELLDHVSPLEFRGSVAEVRGMALRVADLPVPIGAMVRILTQRGSGPELRGEVVAFQDDHTVIMPFGPLSGIRRGDWVVADQFSQLVRVSDTMLGRVLNAMGDPIDGGRPLLDTIVRPLHPRPIDPLDRALIDEPLATGVRAIDALVSFGRGQRVGLFAGPGVGKSTLMAMLARHTAADVTVLALVGERGREVRDFLDNQLGPEGLARSIVVCATSDEPALLRLRAAAVATSIAEHFRDQGLDVLLMMDSVTRWCHAQREVGLAAGEPPATRGYPPSVFSLLPTLLERAGRTTKGSITGIYSVLVEGDDMTGPVADAVKGILDGHVTLSRDMAQRGHYPAIDVLESVSRVIDDVTPADQQAARKLIIRLLAAYKQVEDLLNIGAYAFGSNGDFDLAIQCKTEIDQLLQQGRHEVKGAADFGRTRQLLLALQRRIEDIRKTLTRPQRAVPQGPKR
jgi:flagellum-specific ATP synthase